MNTNSFLSKEEIYLLGFESVGENVLISRKASFYGAENIVIGNHVRIDDFSILSGKIELYSYIHISAYTALYGGEAGIIVNDFSGISARTIIYAMTDDFSGEYMVGSMIDKEYRNIIAGTVYLNKYVQIGAGCVILPDLFIDEGAVVGAMSLVNKSLDSWNMYAGIPCRYIKNRKRNILEIKEKFKYNL